MPDKSHPYVDNVSMNGDQINLYVEVTDFQAGQGFVEISGQATQVGGAFATISQVVDVARATKESDGYFVTVAANAIPPTRFKKDQDITVFVRVARTWVTVLGEPNTVGSEEAGSNETTTWEAKKSSQLTNSAWPAPNGSSAADPG